MRKTFFSLFDKTLDLMNQVIYIIIGLAVLGFMWGIVKILFNRDNEIAKKEGRDFMLYGILTLFVMTSMWGLVNLLNGSIEVKPIDYQGDVNEKYSEEPATSPETQFPSVQNAQDLFNTNSEQRAI